MKKDYTQIILDFLKTGEKPVSLIASKIRRNVYDCQKILDDLESEELIEKFSFRNRTYWRLKSSS